MDKQLRLRALELANADPAIGTKNIIVRAQLYYAFLTSTNETEADQNFLKADDDEPQDGYVDVDWVTQSVTFYENGALQSVMFADDEFAKALLDGKAMGLNRKVSVIDAARSKVERLSAQKLQS